MDSVNVRKYKNPRRGKVKCKKSVGALKLPHEEFFCESESMRQEDSIKCDMSNEDTEDYVMVFLINKKFCRSLRNLAANVSRGTLYLYAQMLYNINELADKLDAWENQGEKIALYEAMNYKQILQVQTHLQLLELPYSCVERNGSSEDVTKYTITFAFFCTKEALNFVTANVKKL